MVALVAADRHQRVRALRQDVGDEILSLRVLLPPNASPELQSSRGPVCVGRRSGQPGGPADEWSSAQTSAGSAGKPRSPSDVLSSDLRYAIYRKGGDPQGAARTIVLHHHYEVLGPSALGTISAVRTARGATARYGGSPCPIEVMRQVIDNMHMSEIIISYGMTETSPTSMCTSRDDTPRARGRSLRTSPRRGAKIVPAHDAMSGFELRHTPDMPNDPALIAEYEQWHRDGWPGIKQSIRDGGITEMDIYRVENRLFMIMETSEGFNFEKKAALDASNPNVKTWEDLMWKYQLAIPGGKPGEKWRLMEQIYSLTGTKQNNDV